MQGKRGASKYLWPFSSKSGESKPVSAVDGGMLSETDTTGGGDVSADETTIDTSRPSSRQGNFTASSRDGKEEKEEKEEKSREKKAAKHRRGNSIMDLFKFKVRSAYYSLSMLCLSQCSRAVGPLITVAVGGRIVWCPGSS